MLLDGLATVAELIEPTLADGGFELVRVVLLAGPRPTLQVMAERADRRPMDVEDCAGISHAVSALLDVHDPVAGAYTLEVSSPGIDRPLTRPEHFVRFEGHEARLELDEPKDGRKRFTGRIDRVADNAVTLKTHEGEAVLPFAAIRKAKLVLTDALIEAARRERAAG